MSEGVEIDPNSPEIIQELLDATSEWSNIQEIVKLTFKGVYQVLKAQDEAIREMEQVLPMKANKAEVSQQFNQKANLIDMKKTMAEVAANIESRTTYDDVKRMMDDKITKQEVMFLIQQKVSYDEMKEYLDQAGSFNQQDFEQELNRMRQRMEETYKDLQKKTSSNIGNKEIQQLQVVIEARITELEERINEKANKQSVAQALHRKANRPEIDAILTKKADLSDLQRIIGALENKIDITSFESLVRAVEMKADRQDLNHIPQSFRMEKSEIDRAVQQFGQEKYDLEKRIMELDRQIQTFTRQNTSEVEQVKSLVNMNLQQKADYRDLDQIAHNIHAKADIEKVQELVSQLRNEVVSQMQNIKKDVTSKTKKKEDDIKKRKQEVEFATEKAFEEIKILKDKMQRLAAQFDKELSERDKQIKTFQNLSQTDIQKAFSTLNIDIEGLKKLLADLDGRKLDKREQSEIKSKIMAALDTKAESSDIQSAISTITTEQTQKGFELKSELFKKVTEMQNYIQQSVGKKISIEEFNEALSQKVDLTLLRNSLEQKVNVQETEGIRRMIDKIVKEIEFKSSYKDLENHINFSKNSFEEFHKELLLKASIKDVCTLLDQKANVEDVNQTLSLVQREVEKTVTDDVLRKALNDQALINEALCAQNCLGRWIWKTGDIKNQNQVPWEVQALNTCPDNFLWEKNKTSIITVAPGLYEISFGFYSKKQPIVQIHVNGEAILSVNQSQQVTDHGKENRISNIGKHSAGNVTGLTLLDFIALPARARVSLTFSSESGGEGFLNLRKL